MPCRLTLGDGRAHGWTDDDEAWQQLLFSRLEERKVGDQPIVAQPLRVQTWLLENGSGGSSFEVRGNYSRCQRGVDDVCNDGAEGGKAGLVMVIEPKERVEALVMVTSLETGGASIRETEDSDSDSFVHQCIDNQPVHLCQVTTVKVYQPEGIGQKE